MNAPALAFAGSLLATAAAGPPAPAPAPEILQPPASALGVPHHSWGSGFVFGGHAALRLAHDRVAGVSNPDWLSVSRVSGFAVARVHSRVDLVGEAAYDRATDDLTVERAKLDFRLSPRRFLQVGVLLPPLGRANVLHDSPRGEFNERSLVATELVGVPNSQAGIGVRGFRPRGERALLSYELDLVAGYDDGIVAESGNGTRLPSGRNGFLDDRPPAIAARVALHPDPATEFGLGAIAGPYTSGAPDRSRWMGLLVGDGVLRLGRYRLAGELGFASVDVAPGLEGLFAEQQWGGALEIATTLREPLRKAWRSSSASLALRADAVDLDLAVPGDSRSRLCAGLNLRHASAGVLRIGWYYEIAADRFDNRTPSAGATLTLAAYL